MIRGIEGSSRSPEAVRQDSNHPTSPEILSRPMGDGLGKSREPVPVKDWGARVAIIKGSKSGK